MQSFLDWFQKCGIDKNRPWLIFGKGPSFSKRTEYDLSGYYTLSLNHAVREQPVTVAHMIDYDVVGACGEFVEKNAKYLVLPWIPHVNSRPGRKDLGELVRENSILKKMDEQGRLLWYNLSTAPRRHGDSPVIDVRFFSAEAALNLLACAGVRQIRSLGIDGGSSYSTAFNDLKDSALLANRRKSFNRQFEKIARIIMNTGIDYAPLDVQSPIRIYVGSTEVQMLAVKVLEYSVRKHASMNVEVIPLHLAGIEIPTPKDMKNQPRTPFSFQRFIIPQLAGYRGRAIYVDSDMQVFKDIRALWTLPFNGADVLTIREPYETGRRPQFSVMLLNCDALKWDIKSIVEALDQGTLTYEKLVYDMALAKQIRGDIDPAWNCLERYHEGETALLHYTDMDTQPWVSTDNPLGYVWMRDLFEAIDQGFITTDYIRDHVKRGYVRPSLLYQVEQRLDDSLLLPKKARLLDKDFIAPYQTIHKHGATPWMRPTKFMTAVLRHYLHQSRIYRFSRYLCDQLSRK